MVIDAGKIVIDEEAESLRGAAVTVTGNAEKVAEFIGSYPVLHRDALGSLASISIRARLSQDERVRAKELGLELSPVSLQQLVVRSAMGTQDNDTSDVNVEAMK